MLNLGDFPHKDFSQNRVTIAFTYLLFLFMKKKEHISTLITLLEDVSNYLSFLEKVGTFREDSR